MTGKQRTLMATMLASFAGCASPSLPRPLISSPLSPSRLPAIPTMAAKPTPASGVQQAAYTESIPSPASQTSPPAPTPQALPGFGKQLTSEAVIAQVLGRNPTVAQMAAAIDLVAAKYPQVTSLDDPLFTTWIAPASFGSNRVGDSARFELSQKIPFPGKLDLRGNVVQSQVTAAGHDLADIQLQLVESARQAFADYYLAERSLEVNSDGLKLIEEFKQNAETRYRTGQTPQQDILQATVEYGRQSEQRLLWQRARTVAIARLNTLMNLPADTPLPPAAKEDHIAASLPEPKSLRDLALSRRPDLQAMAARIASDAASLGVAEREYYPDFDAMASYDSFWMDKQQQTSIGVRTNLPVRLARRRGAVNEAVAQLMQRRASLNLLQNQVGFDVQQAYAQLRESEQSVKLYADKILPAARENIKSAQSAYMTGKIPFLTLIEAQRSLIELRDRSNAAIADYEKRLATLERVLGGPMTTPDKTTPNP